MSPNAKWTAADLPDRSGRVAVVSGSNMGLGYETALVLGTRGAHVVLAVRDVDEGNAAAARLHGRVPRADGIRELRGHPKRVESSQESHGQDVQGRLWTVSEQLTGVTYPA